MCIYTTCYEYIRCRCWDIAMTWVLQKSHGMSGVRCCRGAEPLIKSGWRSPKAHHLPSVTLWLTVCHGKSQLFMGKSTISMFIFHSYVKPEGNWSLDEGLFFVTIL